MRILSWRAKGGRQLSGRDVAVATALCLPQIWGARHCTWMEKTFLPLQQAMSAMHEPVPT